MLDRYLNKIPYVFRVELLAIIAVIILLVYVFYALEVFKKGK